MAEDKKVALAQKKAPEKQQKAPVAKKTAPIQSADKLQQVLEVLASASPKIGRALREAGLL